MLGVGWTEMLVIGVVALIVIGPKDLPVVMARLGKVIGQVRRMGNEFQREISKTTGLDEIRNLRTSITEPLRKTTEDIRREFNTITPSGVQPSGLLKPADPQAQSVVDEIKTAAGLRPTGPVMLPLKEAGVADKPVRKGPVRAKAVPPSTRVSAEIAPLAEAPVKARRVAKPKIETAISAAPAEAAAAPVKKIPARKTAAKPASIVAEPTVTKPARKPAVKKPAAPQVGEA